jgi:two-component system, LytTR family, response regulator
MEKVSVLIIEDTPAESNALIQVLEAHEYSVVGVARSHQEALELFYTNKVDILVIDIFLNGIPEGISFAETINSVPNAARPFVFLTSSTDRGIFERAKLTRPFSFLLKPFNELEVLYALEMAVEKFYTQVNVFQGDEQDTVISKDYLFIKKNDSLKKVRVADIVYIEVEERYCTIRTESEKFVIHISLTKIIELLDPALFSRTHRNFIVNLEKIEEIQPSDNLVILTGKHLIPVSEKYKDFLQRFRTLK